MQTPEAELIQFDSLNIRLTESRGSNRNISPNTGKDPENYKLKITGSKTKRARGLKYSSKGRLTRHR